MITFPESAPIYSHKHKLRSRYGETDQMGYVYYGHYLGYFEVARTEMIRQAGYSYRQLEEDGYMLPVIYSQIAYKSPIFYDEEMTIEVLLFDEPAVKLNTYYKIWTDRRDTPHILGEVTLCFAKMADQKPCRAPNLFMEKIRNS